MATRSTRTGLRGGTDEPRHRIGLVARKTGIAAHTLRAWERRYGSLSPGRMSGGGRLYSDDDIARLRLLKQLTERGHAIGSIATLAHEELARMASEEREQPAPSGGLERLAIDLMAQRFLDAIAAFDVQGAARILSNAALVLPMRELVCSLLAPLLVEIGARWERGELTVAHEHAASNLLRNELGTYLRGTSNQPHSRTLVAATLPGEQHEFGALLASLLAAAHGFRVVYLGTSLPTNDIAHAVRDARAEVLLLSIVNDFDASTRRELKALREALPRTTLMCVGGRGARHVKQMGAGIRHVKSLDELDSALPI
nr:MerR transcriptional regulator [uncultured bacterium]ANY58039.1 MerR transcriptional regulator [uncultured bacterium]